MPSGVTRSGWSRDISWSMVGCCSEPERWPDRAGSRLLNTAAAAPGVITSGSPWKDTKSLVPGSSLYCPGGQWKLNNRSEAQPYIGGWGTVYMQLITQCVCFESRPHTREHSRHNYITSSFSQKKTNIDTCWKLENLFAKKFFNKVVPQNSWQ